MLREMLRAKLAPCRLSSRPDENQAENLAIPPPLTHPLRSFSRLVASAVLAVVVVAAAVAAVVATAAAAASAAGAMVVVATAWLNHSQT